MPYLNLDPDYPEHRKTLRLIARLGDLADAIPVRLWAYCAKYHPKDGALRGYTVAEIETLLRWKGLRGEAVSAMVEVGFLEDTKDGLRCHDWRSHEGHLDAFSRRGKIANRVRWDRYRSSIHKGVLEGVQEDDLRNPPALPNHTKPNQALPERKIVPPSLEMVKAYCLERRSTVDPQHFIDYNEARGWMMGKSKMKDWQATIRTWEKNNVNRSGGTGVQGRVVGGAAPVPGKYADAKAAAESRQD